MASTACFLHHHALTTASARSSSSQRQVVNVKQNQIVICRAQKQAVQEEDGAVNVSRRLALTALIGAAALGSKVSPADAAYGESGKKCSLAILNMNNYLVLTISQHNIQIYEIG